MRNYSFLLLAALFASCSTPEKRSSLVMSIDSVMNAMVDTAEFNGNVLISRAGKVIYQRSFGLANFTTGDLLNDSTMFELASVSKQFTAMAVMILKERGKLSYEDDIRKFIPELP